MVNSIACTRLEVQDKTIRASQLVIIPKRIRYVTSPLRPSLSHRWGFGRCRDIDARSSFEEILDRCLLLLFCQGNSFGDVELFKGLARVDLLFSRIDTVEGAEQAFPDRMGADDIRGVPPFKNDLAVSDDH